MPEARPYKVMMPGTIFVAVGYKPAETETQSGEATVL